MMEPNLFIKHDKVFPCELQDAVINYSLESLELVQIVQ